MTAHENTLYVKLGPQATTVPQSDRHDPLAPGHLAALDLGAEKKRLFEIRLLQDEWGAGWAFEGAPLVDGGNLYVAMRRRNNLRAQAHVACFRIKPNRAELRWRRFIAAAETLGQGQHTEYTHTMLTLDQGVLFVNTNLGAVAALAAETGEIHWIARYPRAPIQNDDPDRSRLHLFRDLNPCLVHKDLVMAAPTDSDQVFALDAATGMVLWSTGPQRAVDAVHLLGVGGGHLIASGHRLYWIDIHNGRIAGKFPARVQDALRGYGRGILAGRYVYWPTRERIYIFDQHNMRQMRQPIDLAPIGMTGGNLVIVDGVLLIASAGRLAAFSSGGRELTKTGEAP
jgi:outer membrane protein assembly factor BamB